MKKRSLNKIKQMVSIGMSCIMAGSTCNLPMMLHAEEVQTENMHPTYMVTSFDELNELRPVLRRQFAQNAEQNMVKQTLRTMTFCIMPHKLLHVQKTDMKHTGSAKTVRSYFQMKPEKMKSITQQR